MSALLDWFAKFPRNAQISVQRLTLYGWIRLIVVVAVYLLIRPYLLKYVERAQTRSYEQVVNTHPVVTPNVIRERVEEEEGEMDRAEREYATAEATATEEVGYGEKARRRQRRAIGEVVRREVDEDEEADVEFLKRYCM